MSSVVIFGGSGFIGCFFADFLIKTGKYDKIYLYDLESFKDKPFPYRTRLLDGRVEVQCITGDVRKKIEWIPDESVEFVANFAAIHREPGHLDFEYFETNLLGAENVTEWCSRVGCKNMLFTSSISPYGISEDVKDEATLPVPVTAYGSSKLVAEKIHIAWQGELKDQRVLIIARPGVVFGPGEGGNVTRLVKAVRKGYFLYMGNKDTRKAGIYVKELCAAFWWCFDRQKSLGPGVTLFNGSMNPGPSISEYVTAVCNTAKIRRSVFNIPYHLLLSLSFVIDAIAGPVGIKHPFSPVRIKKLVRSNNISPSFLVAKGYDYYFDLESAMQDWKNDCPEEWN
jgi:nucleoside-diphosphate-sugar epimerase